MKKACKIPIREIIVKHPDNCHLMLILKIQTESYYEFVCVDVDEKDFKNEKVMKERYRVPAIACLKQLIIKNGIKHKNIITPKVESGEAILRQKTIYING